MYTYKHAQKFLYSMQNKPGMGKVKCPTGHVYGTLTLVKELAETYGAVILVVDSKSTWRKELVPTYKTGRHVPVGNFWDDYNIFDDLEALLTLCTSLHNVRYIRESGHEADDIIASYIYQMDKYPNWDFSFYFNDNDILQTYNRTRDYTWFNSVTGKATDKLEYILKKYSVAASFLPIWHKVIRGDVSDCIPMAIARFPAKHLATLCEMLKYVVDFNVFISTLQTYSHTYMSSHWQQVFSALSDPKSELLQALYRNYKVVKPLWVDTNTLRVRKKTATPAELDSLLALYNIKTVQLT
jgi:hypothetical protein